jgi:hypothetical protein
LTTTTPKAAKPIVPNRIRGEEGCEWADIPLSSTAVGLQDFPYTNENGRFSMVWLEFTTHPEVIKRVPV